MPSKPCAARNWRWARGILVFDGLRNRIAVAVAPTIEALANAFVALASDGGILRSAVDTLIGNLEGAASYAATFAAVMAGRWVAGMAAAALSVRGLATALVFLRGALSAPVSGR